jgi:hypothetical protein
VNVFLPAVAVVVFAAALGLIIWSARTVQRDYVPRRELGTVVVARCCPTARKHRGRPRRRCSRPAPPGPR